MLLLSAVSNQKKPSTICFSLDRVGVSGCSRRSLSELSSRVVSTRSTAVTLSGVAKRTRWVLPPLDVSDEAEEGEGGLVERGEEEEEGAAACGVSVDGWSGLGWTALSGAFKAERCTTDTGSGCVVLCVSCCGAGSEARRP